MSHNTNTDLTEEDAADLQFPKDDSFNSQHNVSISNCANCENELNDVFILCVQCDLNVCTLCFSNGAEFGTHKNDHRYKVLNSCITFFQNSDWTAKEEMIMLNGLLTFNNWHTIAKQLPNRTPEAIKVHYETYYLEKCSTLFGNQTLREGVYKEPIIPYRLRLDNIQEPLRVSEGAPAGYNAARSDFESDFDKNAEDLITGLETLHSSNPRYAVLSSLQVAVINSYRRRVYERQRRKNIIREHGLIIQQKIISWLHRFKLTVTPQVCEKLVRFMQFYSGEGFEYFMEGLHRAGELKLQIARLCEFRKRGIKTLEEAHLYLKLKSQREELLKDVKRYQQISELNLNLKNHLVPVAFAPSKRRPMTPLEISGMPGYRKLLPKERDLCRSIRLPPLSYLELKTILIGENNKMGFLKLLTARRLLKIDVNKTRKLYDFLIQEGYIKKPKD